MPPATVLPATVLPATVPPVTVLPATVLPATVLPATVLPATVPPVTLLPATVLPATVPPVTVLPVTPELNSSITTQLPKVAGGKELFNEQKTIDDVVGLLTKPPAKVPIYEILKKNVGFLVNNTNNRQRRLN